ncbi:MAG: HigA family addiction module antitoxin [Mariprofundus sp.]
MSTMHNPPHPGAFIREVYLDPFKVTYRQAAASLNVSPSTFNRLVMGKSNVSPEMALRLSKAFGRSPESWLAMQDHYDLWQARSRINLDDIKRMAFA